MDTNNVQSHQKRSFFGPEKFPLFLFIGFAALIGILLLPTPEGLSPAGHRMLAILVFAIIVWVSEAVSYEASSIIIMGLIIFLVGLSPSLKDPTVEWGVKSALTMALAGFSSSGLALVAAALFIAACMTYTGLDKRIALNTMNLVGTSTKSIFFGMILVTIILSLVVPSATARAAAMIPIAMGMVAAFGVENKSKLAVGLMILVAECISIWNVGIQTAAAQNLITVGFMTELLGERVAWIDWLIAALPWSIIMSFVLYFVVLTFFRPEVKKLEGGKQSVRKQLDEIGPMTSDQLRLLIVSTILIGFWATEGKLHNYSTAATTIVALGVLLIPKIGVINWKEMQKRTPWGTLIVFGTGISLGSSILKSGAGEWLGNQIVVWTGLDTLGPLMIFAILAAFLIIIHLGFASATALSSSMIPIVISILKTMPDGSVDRLGMTMILGFVISYGFILPVNAPQNMVCLGTDTFNAKQFAKVGITITIIGYLLMVLFAGTYWDWLGHLK
ncbi:DASS family sodium-coupled anion symporter [Taylorella asinigenitalis]|uniref:Putative Sodium:sulfate symportert n=1 Tax=Taylorella asinigenitalis (strain MCE3) TaxID=1008459 RepID=G4QDP1_TAYAM|nr:DASS family sodium-coupled anion symporter [Taylorella asinigenitalis]AEP36058.1 putative Sodium:sulfate symportert [Taylorella asinigenitalis MCE3]